MESKKVFPPSISVGGLIGGIIGAVGSTVVHKEHESEIKKAAKTGVFAFLGYLIGMSAERVYRKNTTPKN